MRVLLLIAIAAMAALSMPVAGQAKAVDEAEDLQVCQSGDKPDASISACTRFIQVGSLDPDDMATAYLSRGSIYLQKDDCARAIPDFGETLRLGRDEVYAYALRGVCQFRSKQYDQAIADYTQALKLGPDPDLLGHRAEAYEAKGDHASAAADKAAAARLKATN